VTTFALVHGAWHAAWHWHLVEAELARRGHRGVAVDLPCTDPQAGAGAYADVVCAALSDVDGDDVVVVGHSLGGLTIPLGAAARPVRRLVYLAAMIPLPGHSIDDQVATGRADGLPVVVRRGLGAGQIVHDDNSSEWRPEAAVSVMYPDADPQLAAAAAHRLRRQYWRPTGEVTPLSAFPDVESAAIVCEADAVMNPDWCRHVAAERLGVAAAELPGDHSPFLGRPAALVDLLVR
jgi:pimeloyl-ACP methyl ester carboxylesterase